MRLTPRKAVVPLLAAAFLTAATAATAVPALAETGAVPTSTVPTYDHDPDDLDDETAVNDGEILDESRPDTGPLVGDGDASAAAMGPSGCWGYTPQPERRDTRVVGNALTY